jgi:predicted branched-subunit amino acid permease
MLFIKGLRQDRRTGEPLSRVSGVLGVLLGGLGFAAGVLFWMSLFVFAGKGHGGIRA